ncbi:hypothetical protein AVEN_205406-1 [Araneus ventricosus]|uniref:Uncharacterized protein n=1 Tax=Araneus ventricosus TaxID=182803 RepID=A0A4Y2NV94_ARAVE|nr:hypothetical protein AVEN_205406-1 [Araneus ventricosus]
MCHSSWTTETAIFVMASADSNQFPHLDTRIRLAALLTNERHSIETSQFQAYRWFSIIKFKTFSSLFETPEQCCYILLFSITAVGVWFSVTSQFKVTQRLRWDVSLYSKPPSDDEDDTSAVIPSPSYRTTPGQRVNVWAPT